MNRTAMLLAGAACAAALTPTLAAGQAVFPAAELHGAGSGAAGPVLVQALNCIGNPGSHAAGNIDTLNPLGIIGGTVAPIAEGAFTETVSHGDPLPFSCDTQEIQPDFEARYVAAGAELGRKFWVSRSNQLPGTHGWDINPFGQWTTIQFALSETPLTAGDLLRYDAANTPQNSAGAPIQFPLFVLPVAIAYSPTYARMRQGSGVVSLQFNLKPEFVTTDRDGNPTGGIRLTRNAYCRIFNGDIVNWNDPDLKTNGVDKSLMDPRDSVTRWQSVGVPIRLVGFLDRSGTTDILTRHLAAVCDGQPGVAHNAYDTDAEALPYEPASQVDLRPFRGDTPYYPGSTAPFAGTVQRISGAVYRRAANLSPARIDTTQGIERPGTFLLADGSIGVREAIEFQPEPGPGAGAIELNGKLGYIGADWVKPAPGATLFSAALQIGGSGRKYASPTAEQAHDAFPDFLFLAPQSTRTGSYDPDDTRTGPRRDGLPGSVPIDRANPLHWTSVLYSNPDASLATTIFGYPITGTTQVLTYTCFAEKADRNALDNALALLLARRTVDSGNDEISSDLFTGERADALGLFAQMNVAPIPLAWRTAIYNTFVVRAADAALGDRFLWIQEDLPTRAHPLRAANPGCDAHEGG